MELLAPVGSKESFITAIRGGANAVYVGVPDFNARIAASNISLYDLQVLMDHARSKGVKVFLALNTLIKHEEIHDVVKNITWVESLAPDAVIVQDLGVASIILKYFPDLELHASTQMAVHNRQGVDFLAAAGFKRAIMARELSFSELKIITKGSPIPIEVFCHGALCFSVSGMCLFSSYIGGFSGNRGRCTQPCRRLWRHGGSRHGYLFSPRDLELAEHIGKLKKIGIACLKIEGRMRSSEYVYRTVKAYRLLIDAPEADYPRALQEAQAILSGDSARAKTSCLFSGRDTDIFQPKEAQCLGNRIGRIEAVSDGALTIALADDAVELVIGDRLRLSNPDNDTTISFKVKEFTREGLNYAIPFGKTEGFAAGNPVYRTVDATADQKDIERDIDAMYESYAVKKQGKRKEVQIPQAYTALISNAWKESKNKAPAATAEDVLWVRFDNLQWLDILPPPGKFSRYVYYLTKENLHRCGNIPQAMAPQITVELPPFIGQRDLPLYQQCVDKMAARGVRKWVVNNVGQFAFFKDAACELAAGQFLYTWNAYAAAFLADRGVTRFTSSWEDDFLNIRKRCGPGLGKFLVVYLYGYPPVARSRIITPEMLSAADIREHAPSADAREGRVPAAFSLAYESELAVLIPEKPVNIFTARRKLRECGIENYGIDLSFTVPDRKTWKTVFDAYELQANVPDTAKFNFKRGVK